MVGDRDETTTKKKKKMMIEGDSPKGEFELLVVKEGPKVVLERVLRKGAKGVGAAGQQKGEEGEEVVEKTLFQK